jgi:hypothetical protein
MPRLQKGLPRQALAAQRRLGPLKVIYSFQHRVFLNLQALLVKYHAPVVGGGGGLVCPLEDIGD